MQEVTPSVVPTAVSMAMSSCTAYLMISFLFTLLIPFIYLFIEILRDGEIERFAIRMERENAAQP